MGLVLGKHYGFINYCAVYRFDNCRDNFRHQLLFGSHNKSASEIQTLKEANEHEIEKLMKQHEVDLDNLKETHKLEMEKLEAEHRYSLELANSNAQNEMTKKLMGSMVGNMMAAPQMQDFLMKAISDSYMKGQQE